MIAKQVLIIMLTVSEEEKDLDETYWSEFEMSQNAASILGDESTISAPEIQELVTQEMATETQTITVSAAKKKTFTMKVTNGSC